MTREKVSPQRVHESLIKEIEDIRVSRITSGKDKASKPLSFREVTGILPRHSSWKSIKEEMKKLDRKMFNRRGGLFSLINVVVLLLIIIIIGFVIIVFSATWDYGFNTLTESIQGINGNSNSNISYYGGDVVFGNLNIGFQQLEWISYMLIFGLTLGAFIGMFVIKEHPAFFGIYIILVSVVLFISIFISRAYEKIYLSGGVIGSQLKSWGASSWLILNLPEWVTILAFIGAILLFVVFNRDSEQGSIT